LVGLGGSMGLHGRSRSAVQLPAAHEDAGVRLRVYLFLLLVPVVEVFVMHTGMIASASPREPISVDFPAPALKSPAPA
jgi:hypothetical protein